jgi:TRAP-type uncharacterized transport system fused permease subunit
VVITAVTISGVGNTFSLMIGQWSGGSVFVAIVLVALASLVLGMGLPVAAAYIVIATLAAPALADLMTRVELVNAIAAGTIPTSVGAMLMLGSPELAGQIGQPMSRELAEQVLAAAPLDFYRMIVQQALDPAVVTMALLAAHLIIFWLSQDSSVTPPVCLTAFAAAAIAGSKPMATGVQAWKMAKGLYIIPLLFAYSPILYGTFWEKIEVTVFTLAALYAMASAIEGHMEARLSWLMRAVMAGLCVVLIWPVTAGWHWGAFALFLVLVAWNVWQDRRGAGRAAPA